MSTTTMWRRGALAAMTVGTLAAGTLGLAPVAMAAPVTTNVHGGDIVGWNTVATPTTPVPPMPSGWFKQSDNQLGTTATGAVVADSTEQVNHDGSLHLATPAAADKVVVQHGAGNSLLSAFVTGSYAAKVIAGTTRANYQLVIDCNGATAGGFATLNYGDGVDGQLPADGWKTLDVVNSGNAMWWSTRTLNADGTTVSSATAPTAGGLQGGMTAPHKLSEFKTTCTAGTIGSYGVNMGSGSAGLDGSVDLVNFNDAVTNFQRVTVERISGANRVATAVAASKAVFGNAGSPAAASEVVLASSQGFADGVTGGPLAVAVDGPLLLTPGSSLAPATAAEITRILAKGGTVNVLGGVGAISANVASSLVNLGFEVNRLAGADRYATAVAVAEFMPEVTAVLLTSGTNFPDALSASPAAAHIGGAVLLTKGATMSSATTGFLAARPGIEVFAVGGDAAKAAPSTPTNHKLVGATRYETGTMVAARFFSAPETVVFASGQDFPDALSGGAFAALIDSPIVLVSSSTVHPAVKTYLEANDTGVSGAAVIGGTSVVIETVRASLESTLNGF